MTQNSINNSASILDVDNIRLDGNTISSTDTNGNIVLAPDGSGVISVTAAAIVPSGDRADSLGSASNSWDNVYADGITFDDGSTILENYQAVGTYTPVLEFGGGTTGITYSTQVGRYVRIGRICFIGMIIFLSNKGSSTGDATISGLPFTVAAGNNYITVFRIAAITTTDASHTQFISRIDAGGTSITLLNQGTSVNSILQDTNFANNSYISIDGWFRIA